MTQLEQHQRHLEQALKAFFQNPTPSLAAAIERLRSAIRYQKRANKT